MEESKLANGGYSEVTVEMVDVPSERALEKKDGKERKEKELMNDDDDDNNDDDEDEDKDRDVEGDAPSSSSSTCFLYRAIYHFRRLVGRNWPLIQRVSLVVLLLAYLAYFGYAMYHSFGDEPSIRLLVGTAAGLYCLVRRFVKCPDASPCCRCFTMKSKHKKVLRKVFRWSLYLASLAGAGVVVGLDVAMKRPQNLVCLAGMAALILFSCFLSKDPRKINWHVIFWGVGLQFWAAVLVRKTRFGREAFEWLAQRSVEFLRYADEGSMVVFGRTYLDHRFVFQVMPTIIFFNAVISVLYYLGAVQVFFAKFGKFLSDCLGTSAIESVSAASNLFLSQVETPILVKPFVPDMTKSELFAVMTGGYASIAGSLLWAFAAYGAPINHILTASVMSAPAALAFAKLIYPDERKPTIKAEDAYSVKGGQYGSLLGALSTGGRDGLKMAGVVVVSLLIYTAALEFLDMTVLWFAERAGVEGFTLSKMVAYLFYPVVYLMGFDVQDCLRAARILGVKILTLTMVAYVDLGNIITNGETLRNYVSTTNGSWSYVGDDILLEATNTTLVGGAMTERSGVLATYMMCGLSNIGAIGITVGAFLTVAPSRSKDIFKQATMACVAGNLASFSTACVAGLLITD